MLRNLDSSLVIISFVNPNMSTETRDPTSCAIDDSGLILKSREKEINIRELGGRQDALCAVYSLLRTLSNLVRLRSCTRLLVYVERYPASEARANPKL